MVIIILAHLFSEKTQGIAVALTLLLCKNFDIL